MYNVSKRVSTHTALEYLTKNQIGFDKQNSINRVYLKPDSKTYPFYLR
ncbi:hypothetical protein Cyrtocomes_00386 [Candidatus Cyrtobacter comes]|uniref:Uncharacterized protein n=1 Tax=Candidatus Cyrtobacter comes TaxID=675776 RepID=A0ABU5L7Z2_9RICK|nr:hypothetical protein [Candidatus Cyrtobacter comes]